MAKVLVSLAVSAALAASAAHAKDKPAIDDTKNWSVPTYTGAYQPQGTDERGLWAMDDEDERRLRDSRSLVRDEALNSYVRSVLCKTVGDQRCKAVRLYIVKVPAFNASMSPNGTMRVYTGLLLRVRNEAELASVLGHEFAHFELRHTLADYRRARSGSDLLAWSALLGAIAARMGSQTRTDQQDLQISVLGSIYHFKREDERASDRLGFAYMASAGYRSAAAADVWRGVMNEADRSAQSRGRPVQRYQNVAFFATHPTSLERADTLSLLANRIPGGEIENTEGFNAAMAPWRRSFLEDELAGGDFGAVDYLLDRLAGEHWSADLLYAKAENFRVRGNPRDLVSSTTYYRDALVKDPTFDDAYHGLGLALIRTGNVSEGREALKNYLARKPQAPDAPMLRMMLK